MRNGAEVTPLAVEVGGKIGKDFADFINRITMRTDPIDRPKIKEQIYTDISVALYGTTAKNMWQALGLQDMTMNLTLA